MGFFFFWVLANRRRASGAILLFGAGLTAVGGLHGAPVGFHMLLRRCAATVVPMSELQLDDHARTRIPRHSHLIFSLVMAGCALTLAACSKDETPPETIPFKEATAAPQPVATDEDADETDADSETSADADDPTAAPTPPKPATAPKTGPVVRRTGVSIDSCCGALSTQARIAKEAAKVARYKQASRVCYSISKLVKTGKTSRENALRQVRAVAGNAVPGNCR